MSSILAVRFGAPRSLEGKNRTVMDTLCDEPPLGIVDKPSIPKVDPTAPSFTCGKDSENTPLTLRHSSSVSLLRRRSLSSRLRRALRRGDLESSLLEYCRRLVLRRCMCSGLSLFPSYEIVAGTT